MEKVYSPKAPAWDERNGRWVPMPDARLYLLPVIARETKLTPRFHDGEVTLEVSHQDDELATMCDRFVLMLSQCGRHPTTGDLVPRVDGKGQLVLTPTVYAETIGLVRKLLLRNYALDDDQLSAVLAVSKAKLGKLIDTVVHHLTAKE